MNRYVSIVMVLFGLFFSHIAFGIEWKVESGDSLWKILAEACQVTPSQEKVMAFARATGIRTPDRIRVGSRIDTSRGCAAFSDASSASFEKVVALSAQQGETLRVMQVQLTTLEADAAKLRSDFEAPQWRNAVYQTTVSSVEPERRVGIAQILSSNMEAFVSQGTGAKGFHAFGDPVYFFRGWLGVVLAFCLFIGSTYYFRQRRDSETVNTGESGGSEKLFSSGATPDGSSSLVKQEYQDASLRFLGSGGFITLSVPFTWEMYLKFYQRVREDMNFVSFWCAVPVFVDGRGFETFESDAAGHLVYVNTIDAFKKSVEGSVKDFLDGRSDIGLTRRIIAAVKDGLLRPNG